MVRTSLTHLAAPRVSLFCSYHILTSPMIYYWTDAQQHGIYLLNRSQRTSKCGKNISDTLGCASCVTFLLLPHFDVTYYWTDARQHGTYLLIRLVWCSLVSSSICLPKPWHITENRPQHWELHVLYLVMNIWRLWNCLHPDWRKLTKRLLKRKIHHLLLTVLEIEDYHVDAHSLSSLS